MSCSGNGTAEIASGVDYSLGSPWVTVASSAATFAFKDDGSNNVLLSKTLTPAAVRGHEPPFEALADICVWFGTHRRRRWARRTC